MAVNNNLFNIGSRQLFGPYSMYRKTDPIIVDGISTIGSWVRPSWVINRPADRYIHKYKVPNGQAGRPDLIAYAVYQLDSLDWVLITFNNVIEVFGWPKVGTVIEYPDQSIILPSL